MNALWQMISSSARNSISGEAIAFIDSRSIVIIYERPGNVRTIGSTMRMNSNTASQPVVVEREAREINEIGTSSAWSSDNKKHSHRHATAAKSKRSNRWKNARVVVVAEVNENDGRHNAESVNSFGALCLFAEFVASTAPPTDRQTDRPSGFLSLSLSLSVSLSLSLAVGEVLCDGPNVRL